ncbi:Cell wall surface anchor family protein [Rhodotorula toruloides ATCC 204091]|uniref:BY PROTMAP: gi/342320428/gb/EGU12368.1/ Cell wall surface anchor family protein [Rhodotorula glutinis ATCC 204091] n=1 Tax=Rhodotorula toruloides TaxID=5286 RepID=A0A0K3CEJ7_RHOTO|nr:Cell wall surface anchor family protein [Rhodotorula toruloides ATCC 204091]KAK4332722.1 Cell wall surface anchor family protein [Rhodotorula toruloides]
MADVEVLADPAAMSTEERTDELLRLITVDDLLGVLLVLYCVQGDEIDGVSRAARQTPLEAAISLPTRHAACRRLIVECLLLRGARFDPVLHDPPRQTLPGFIELLQEWRNGGKEAAREAASLLAMDLEDAESYIAQHGLLPDDTGEHLDPIDTPPIPSTSAHYERSQPSHEQDSRHQHCRPPPPQSGDVALSDAMPAYWTFIGNIPLSISERFIFEKLEEYGIRVADVFLSQASRKDRRFAYVAFHTSQEADSAVSLLHNFWTHGVSLLAKPFTDRETGSPLPRLSEWHPLRRYVGAARQAERPSHLRRIGLFLLHLAHGTTEQYIARFAQQSIPIEVVSHIVARQAGSNVLAFIDCHDEQACRKAILDLDGKILNGAAVRVGWQELSGVRAAAMDIRRDYEARQARLSEADSLNKRRRVEDDRPPALAPPSRRQSLNAKSKGKALATPIPRAEASIDWRQDLHATHNLRQQISPGQHADLQVTASTALPSNGAAVDGSSPHAATHSQLHYSSLSDDLSRLSSLELPSEDVEAVERMWTSFDGPASASADRSVELTAIFGFATQDDAVAALEANRTLPGFPNDQLMQRRYESFLRSQAGMDKEWYMAFLTQLVGFNRTNDLFVSALRNSSPIGLSATMNGHGANSAENGDALAS